MTPGLLNLDYLRAYSVRSPYNHFRGLPYAQRTARKRFVFRPPRRRAHSGKRVSSAKHRGKSIDLPARPQLQRGVSARARLRPTTAGIYRGSRRTNATVSTRTTRNRRAHSLERAANAPIPSDSPSGSAAVQQSRGDGGVSATDVLPTPSRTNNRPQARWPSGEGALVWRCDYHCDASILFHIYSI